MSNNINKKQKAFVDELFKNGFNQTKAYQKIYDITNKNYATTASSRLMTNDSVKAYYNHKYEEYRRDLNIDKQKMLDMLMEEINLFNEMKYLAQKGSLTLEEELRFDRLSILLKASDINKARDMINKMIGSYEPEKQEVTHKGIEGIKIEIIKKDDKRG